MAIVFSTDIGTLYAAKVGADTNYTTPIAANLRNATNEQNLLLTLEIVRAYMEQVSTVNEAHIFHQCMRHMLAKMALDVTIYTTTSKKITVHGNVQQPYRVFANGATISITTASGTAAVVLASAPYANMAALVANINSQMGSVPEVQAFVNNTTGTLGFRNTTGNEGVSFTLAAGAGAKKVHIIAGLALGVYVNPIVQSRYNGRTGAIAAFKSPSRPTTL